MGEPRKEIADLQRMRVDLTMRYGPNSPQVKAVDDAMQYYAENFHTTPVSRFAGKVAKVGGYGGTAVLGAGALGLGPAAAGAGGAAGGAAGAGTGAAAAAGGGGVVDWLKKQLSGVDAGDVLKAGGSAVGGYMDARQAAADRDERAREYDESLAQRRTENAAEGARFDRTQGANEAQLAVQARTAINKSPMADKAQALLLARMGAAPTTLQPRDWTRDVTNVRGASTGGPADQMATAQQSAAAYTPGSGGVDTSALRVLLAKMGGGGTQAPRAAPVVRPRGLPGPVNRYAY